MNFDPQKFFIGLMDFFSILLPGALLTYLLMGDVGLVVLGDRYAKLAYAEAWAAFLFASYLFGHQIFQIGRLVPWLAPRPLIWLVFKGEQNLAVERAAKIKQQAIGALQAKDAINMFQWSKAWLNAENSAKGTSRKAGSIGKLPCARCMRKPACAPIESIWAM